MITKLKPTLKEHKRMSGGDRSWEKIWRGISMLDSYCVVRIHNVICTMRYK